MYFAVVVGLREEHGQVMGIWEVNEHVISLNFVPSVCNACL